MSGSQACDPALGSSPEEEFAVVFGYTVCPRTTWATGDLVSEKGRPA